ncbi:autotransporter-associated beta strand repeat-containing protein [Burkholderiaceae bacterium DAT-1]|nr:autotransporter-associated beta strand repeat-containing protein [Burkholderiaceae bacterium DAT-1]
MNHVYAIVWNHVRQCFVVASEQTRSHGKPGSSKKVAVSGAAALCVALGAPAVSAADPFPEPGLVSSEVKYDNKKETQDRAGKSGYFVSGSSTLDLSNGTLTGFTTTGGSGSGGGAGLGGAIFIGSKATVNLTNVDLVGNMAVGGLGGDGNVGGALNGFANFNKESMVGVNGTSGGTPEHPMSDDANGTSGWKGQSGYNGSGISDYVSGAGGGGGKGGNGGQGSEKNLVLEARVVVSIAAEAAAAAAILVPGFDPKGTAVAIADLALATATLAADRQELSNWESALEAGQIGIGGQGGNGGNGGNGYFGSGGGMGGGGGDGGKGGRNWLLSLKNGGAAGGNGGDGGKGGNGGFGAGGGRGGAAGKGGEPGISFREAGSDGSAGAGGLGGFGAGNGSDGDGIGGDGGSGFGGAIFVSERGILNINGNATFDQNGVIGGVSKKGGNAGQAAGTDLFMMKDSIVSLLAGKGNTITFNGSIADNSAASVSNTNVKIGEGASLTIGNGGTVKFNGENTYTGATNIANGLLVANDGIGINRNSNIAFGDKSSSSNEGVLQTTSGVFNRFTGSAPNRVQWLGSGGFAAEGQDLKVTLNSGAKLTWGQAGFVGGSNALVFGSEAATNKVEFTNAIDLANGKAAVKVFANQSDSVYATLSGVISNGTLVVGDSNHTGTLILTGKNTYLGTELSGGMLKVENNGTLGGTNSAYSYLKVNLGTVDISKAKADQTTGTLSGSIGTEIKLGSKSLTIHQAEKNTFAGVISGDDTSGVMVAGSQNLILSGQNTYSGSTEIASGATLTLGRTNTGIAIKEGSLASRKITVQNTGTFNVETAGLSAQAKLDNHGTINLGADNTVDTFTNNGEINNLVLAGTPNVVHTLTAKTYNLNDSAKVNVNLGTGKIIANGRVNLNGKSDALLLDVQTGTTTLGAFGDLSDMVEVSIDANTAALDLSGAADQTIRSLTGTGKVALGSKKLKLNQDIDAIYEGSIQDGGSSGGTAGKLEKLGAGHLTLSGDNTYTGATTLSAGAITLTGTLDSQKIDIAKETKFTDVNGGLSSTAEVTNQGVLDLGTDEGIAHLVNSGTLDGVGKTLTATKGYELQDGSIINANLGMGSLKSDGSVALNGTVDAEQVEVRSGTTTFGSAGRLINAATALHVESGATLVTGGAEAVDGLYGAGVINLAKGGLTVDRGSFQGNLIDDGKEPSDSALIKNSNATLDLYGSNTITGHTQVNAGTLNLFGSLSSKSVEVAKDAHLVDVNGKLADGATLTNNGEFTLGVSDTIGKLVNSGTVNGVGNTLTAEQYDLRDGSVIDANLGTGSLTANGEVALNGKSDASVFAVQTGTTKLGVNGDLFDKAAVSIESDNATLDLSRAKNQTIGSLSGVGTVALGTSVLTLDQNVDTTFSGSIKEDQATKYVAGLRKLGTGNLTLSGKNTYTGWTTVEAGKLTLTGSLDSRSVYVGTDSTLIDANSGLQAYTELTSKGKVVLGADEEVRSIVNNGTLDGVGKTLTANQYFMLDGSVANANLSNGYLYSSGTVALNGTIGALVAMVQSGTTTLGSAGRFTNAGVNVQVDKGATLVTGGKESIYWLRGEGTVNLAKGSLTVEGGSFYGRLVDEGKAKDDVALVKTGNYMLDLYGDNAFAGKVKVNAGTLNLLGTLSSKAIDIAKGATFVDVAGGLADAATVSNDGRFSLGDNETIATLVNSGTVSGLGKTLTAKQYDLRDGSVIDANLGTGNLTANGNVTLNGKSDASAFAVQTGTTTLGRSSSLNTAAAVSVEARTAKLDLSAAANQTVGSIAGAGTISLGGKTLTLNQNSDTLFAGSLQDGGVAGGSGASLVKRGNGNLTLSGSNTFSGSTTINAGAITLTGSLASNLVTINQGGALFDLRGGLSDSARVVNFGRLSVGENDQIAALINSGIIDGTGTLSASTYALGSGSVVNANLGGGTLTADGAVTINGTSAASAVEIKNGTTRLGSGGRLTNSSVALQVNGDAALLMGGSESINTLAGAGQIALGNGTLSLNSGSFSGRLVDGSEGARGSLVKNSDGSLTLSGQNTYTGQTLIHGGMLDLQGSLASDSVVVDAGAQLNNAAAGLANNSKLSNAGKVWLGANQTIAQLVNSGELSGAQGVTLTAANYGLNDGAVINVDLGTGTLTADGKVALNGSTKAESVAIRSGSTTLAKGGRLANQSAALQVDSGANLVLGGNETIDRLTGAGEINVANGALILNQGSFSGQLVDNGKGLANPALVKKSAGTLTLSGKNTFTGQTQVAGGTLDLVGSLSSSSVAIAAGATLNDVNGGLASNARLINNGTVALGTNDVIDTFVNTGVINGAGKTLTAGTYALYGGSVINANLGTGAMVVFADAGGRAMPSADQTRAGQMTVDAVSVTPVSTPGAVNVYGTIAASSINITTGAVLNLGGPSVVADNIFQSLIGTPDVLLNGTINLNAGTETINSLSGTGIANLNAYQLNVLNGGYFKGTINAANSQFNQTGGEFTIGSGTSAAKAVNVSNGGYFAITGNGTSVTVQSASVGSGSVLTVGNGAMLDATQAGGTGTITLDNGSQLNLETGSTLKYLVLNGGTSLTRGGLVNAQGGFVNPLGSSVQGYLTFAGDFTNNGTLSPGNSPGMVAVTGNYTENALYKAEIQTTSTGAVAFDQVRVGGNVTINKSSTLNVVVDEKVNLARGNTFQILANLQGGRLAKAAKGHFGSVGFIKKSDVTGNQAMSNASAVFDVASGQLIATGLDGASADFSQLGANANQRGAMRVIMSAATGDVAASQINSETAAGATAYATLISADNLARFVPEQFSLTSDFALQSGKLVSDLIWARATPAAAGVSGEHTVFAGYSSGKLDEAGKQTKRKDFYVGVEKHLESLSVGFIANNASGDVNALYTSGSAKGQGLTAYAKVPFGEGWLMTDSLGFNRNSFDMHRSLWDGAANANVDSTGVDASIGASYLALRGEEWTVVPRINLAHSSTSIKGFNESGSSAQLLSSNGFNASRTTLQSGVAVSHDFLVGGNTLAASLDLGVDRDLASKGGEMNARLIGDARVQFPVVFASEKKTRTSGGITLGYALSKSMTLTGKVEKRSGGNQANLELRAGF